MTNASISPGGFKLLDPPFSDGWTVFERPGRQDDDPVVVLIHGTLDRGGSFNRLARRLPELGLVTYDRRGYQGSRDIGPAKELQDHIDDVFTIIDAFSPNRPAIVFGHSFGGVIAIASALQAPSRFSHVVAYEPPMPWLHVEPQPHRGITLDDDSGKETELFFRRVVSDAAWERLTPAEKADRISDGPALISDLRIIRMETPFTLEQLRGLDVPVTIGLGTATTMTHHAVSGALVANTIPAGAVTELEGAGHGAHLSHPDGVAHMIISVSKDGRNEASCASL